MSGLLVYLPCPTAHQHAQLLAGGTGHFTQVRYIAEVQVSSGPLMASGCGSKLSWDQNSIGLRSVGYAWLQSARSSSSTVQAETVVESHGNWCVNGGQTSSVRRGPPSAPRTQISRHSLLPDHRTVLLVHTCDVC